MSTVQSLDVQPIAARRPFLSAISWGSIFAGVVVGLSVNLVLNLVGVATGLMSLDIGTPGGGASPNAPLWAAIWNGVSMLIAAFCGGYVAARMSGLKRRSDGILHGFVSWGATTILLTGLFAAAAGALSNQLFSGMARGAASVAQSGGIDFSRQVNAVMRSNGANVNPQTLQQLHRFIQEGNRPQAIDLMVSNMNMDRANATTAVDQLLILSGSPESASSEARASANQAVQTASGVTWGVVLAVLLSLGLGVLGGAMGAAGSRRVPQTITTR